MSSGRTVSEILPSPLEPLGFHMERKYSLLPPLVRAIFSVDIPSACDVVAGLLTGNLSGLLRGICTDIKGELKL